MTILAQDTGFQSALIARERSPDVPESADIFAAFLGSWEIEVFDCKRDGSVQRSNGEVHFARVLDGRAMQLVWIIPRASERSNDASRTGNRYGTTMCIWDNAIDAWRVTWMNPVTNVRTELLARKSGEDIVQLGHHADGTPVRWSFTQIAAKSFRWTGEALEHDGKTWRLEVEFRARR